MAQLFHLADRQQWEAARTVGRYEISTRGKTLREVGFIHCSLRHQVRPVAEAIFAAADDLVLLVIDGDRVPAPIEYEGSPERFPHIYGPLPTDAVVAATPVGRDAAGRWILPDDGPGAG
jgi:uncharacterized protein (DUF952 family)